MGVNYVLSPVVARKVRELVRGETTAASKRVNSPAAISQSTLPSPFAVQYSKENGGFLIYLPPGGGYLVKDGEELTVDGLTAAEGYPSGWFKLPAGVPSAPRNAVYLKIADEPSFVKEPGESGSFVKIAEAKIEEGRASVYQLITSALVIVSGGGEAHWIND